MKTGLRVLLFIVVLIAVILTFSALYLLDETEQAIVTQFGKPVGEPIVTAGLHLKTPFIQKVIIFDKRLLEWDGAPQEIPTRDNKFIHIDTFARWRISNALSFYKSLRNETTAHSRLDDLLDGAVRDEIANRNLPEVIRSSSRPMIIQEIESDDILDVTDSLTATDLYEMGLRKEIAQTILENVREKLRNMDLGIEVIDLKFKRIDYNPEVQQKLFSRMISKQNRIAEKYRAIGQGEKQRILGQIEQKRKQILSEAYLKSQTIRGAADAEAVQVYAKAYNQSAASQEFYKFLRTMESYKVTFDSSATLILSTDNDFLKYLGSPK
jgi:membrane protease subunit HflC